ncbi:MAG: GntR family transcriptional regulator [Flavobacterium sp.]|nr:GntR family transcriptional regulator [Flavobacterium sp.]
MKIISIYKNNRSPIYKQIIFSIEKAIEEKRMKINDRLPSINKVCIEFSLSRDTVLQAYDELKKRGIIYAIPGKGYYVKSLGVSIKNKVFLLFDEWTAFKEDLYNSFINKLGANVQVDIYFHHFNEIVFQKLINESNGNYTKYVVMPSNFREINSLLHTLPVQDVYILDQTNPELTKFSYVAQNFIKDIYNALLEGKSRLDLYQKLILIFPGSREPLEMKIGFEKFCVNHNFEYEIIPEFNNYEIKKGQAFVIPNDRDLVQVIEQSKLNGLKIGQDIGIISYNETPLKKVVENGITTISTDFEKMGELLATMILEGENKQIENKCYLKLRNSL